MDIFSSLSYRDIIRKTLEVRRKDFRKHYTMENLAENCGISSVYLSRALSGKASLTSEQVALACDFLAMNENTFRYTDLVHQLELTKHPKRKAILEKEIQKLRQSVLSTKEYINSEITEVNGSRHQILFLDPMLQVILMFLSIDRFAKDPSKISAFLHLNEEQIIQKINILEKENYIVKRDNSFFTTRRNLHLSPTSEIYNSYNELMALNSIRHYPLIKDPYKYNFNAIFSTDESSRQTIKKLLLELVKSGQELTQKNSKENVYQLNLQLFS